MKTFNTYQIELINKVMAEEAAKDVRIHKGEPQEVTRLYHRYLTENDEIAYGAIIRCLDFWSCYFSCGAEVAFKIRDEEYEKLMQELHEKSQAAIRRMEEEIAEIIAKREAAAND